MSRPIIPTDTQLHCYFIDLLLSPTSGIQHVCELSTEYMSLQQKLIAANCNIKKYQHIRTIHRQGKKSRISNQNRIGRNSVFTSYSFSSEKVNLNIFLYSPKKLLTS